MGDRSESNASAASKSSVTSTTSTTSTVIPTAAIKYTHQAEKLSFVKPEKDEDGSGTAIRADYITPQDPVIVTGDGSRLPGVPLSEAEKLNRLKEDIEGNPSDVIEEASGLERPEPEHSTPSPQNGTTIQKSGEGSLRRAMPPSRTNPLFPPLPLYGPSSLTRDLQCLTFRTTSWFCSLTFLGIVVLGAIFTSIPTMFNHIWLRVTFRNPDARRPFYEEEKRLKRLRKEEARAWKKERSRRNSRVKMDDTEDEAAHAEFIPTEGGPDPLVCDVGYYARRVGLDMEEFKVQTEDGFVITLWHIYNPLEFTPMTPQQRSARGPDIFTDAGPSRPSERSNKKPKFPILMLHGLLQSAGAYCTNDDASLAFYLCKSGYDVWLGNNRCGFTPEHTLLSYSDPRMWAWNIRQMGVMDLPALTSRVLSETGFEKLGLIAHSQGTTQTLVALAKEQRPDLGSKITVFCALAPAAYAGPLIGKAYFKFMRIISPALFRIIFGIHAFIPFMMLMLKYLPAKPYGGMGYMVFHFLFNWSDERWDRGVRDRCFQFAPVYVSAESMRWWLGRECFARQKCILATREEGMNEEKEDAEMEAYYAKQNKNRDKNSGRERRMSEVKKKTTHARVPKGSTSWYDEQVPPFALWVCGSDDLVDGQKLLRRFERGREPHVRVVHSKVIEEYEHLDVIWAMDSIEKVGREVKEVLWKTCDVRDRVRVPRGCEDVEAWVDPKGREGEKGAMEYEEGVMRKEDDGGDQSSSSDN
ncbi:alpha/beta-hydrolase [Mollisia scopiformis]|uniref:Alpha/beta-hydrolase n=1 Tax=Mollisia scopiformis TaxID=149040 RepID=A0A194WSX2_MOLSC|nr:alpha/beta-hydrolase [Mollisia scopiformis]KUJ11051.1 alpha/beta-hydrolase [Mollisia scopiformis]